MTTEPVHPEAPTFLLTEYEHIADSFWRNEEGGERRVNFFITLVTAVLAAVVALATRGDGASHAELQTVTAAACGALLLLGFVTLQRMLRRNKVADRYKDGLDRIRAKFVELDPRLASYDPRIGDAVGRRPARRQVGTGGLAEMVAVVNSLIAAVAAVAASFGLRPWGTALIGGLAFFAALGLQVLHIWRSYRTTT